jgi:hypothetical protein
VDSLQALAEEDILTVSDYWREAYYSEDRPPNMKVILAEEKAWMAQMDLRRAYCDALDIPWMDCAYVPLMEEGSPKKLYEALVSTPYAGKAYDDRLTQREISGLMSEGRGKKVDDKIMRYQKLVYVAGPYNADTERGVLENIRRAEGVAIEVWKHGAVAICPHLNTRFFGGILPEEAWIQGDFSIIRRVDAIMFTQDWWESPGAKRENELAIEQGLPRFLDYEPGWIRFREWLGLEYFS